MSKSRNYNPSLRMLRLDSIGNCHHSHLKTKHHRKILINYKPRLNPESDTVNICCSCASPVHWSVCHVCVHYSFGNIRLIDPFYVRSLFVATGPFSLQVRSCVQSISQIWRTGDFATGHNIFIFGDVR